MASQFSLHRFKTPGWCVSHFSETISNWLNAAFSSGAVYIVFSSFAKAFISLFATYFSVFLTIWTIQRCCSVIGNAAVMASFIPVSPSEQRFRISRTPRFFRLFRTLSQYLLLSFSPITRVSTSFFLLR